MTTSAALEGSINLNTTTGEFSFVAKLDTYGMHDLTVVAHQEGREDTPIEAKIERIPNSNAYAKSATKPDYSVITADPNSYVGVPYILSLIHISCVRMRKQVALANALEQEDEEDANVAG